MSKLTRSGAFTPSTLRRKAALRLTSAAALIAMTVGVGLGASLGVFAVAAAAAITVTYVLLEGAWDLRNDAKTLETIQTDALVTWSFSPFQWKARMKREAEENHAKRPRWIVPIVAAVLAAAAIPFLTEGSPSAVRTPVIIYAVFGLVAFAVLAATVGSRQRERQRGADGCVVIGPSGATVGTQLIDWGVNGKLLSIAFDEPRQALVVRHRVQTWRTMYEADVLLPVPDTERSKAMELVLRLTPTST